MESDALKSNETPLTLPPTLYHYTSQRGFLEIVKSKEIWATNIYYLNDSLEYEYAANLIQDVIDEYLARIDEFHAGVVEYYASKGLPLPPPSEYDPRGIWGRLLEAMKKMLSAISGHVLFSVCSFTEEGDQLTQWRGYCPDGNGFSLGFETSHLIAQMGKHSLTLVKCIYKKEEQVKIIEKIIDNIIDVQVISGPEAVAMGAKGVMNKITEKVTASIPDFMLAMTKLKHETFSEEKEYRFVAIHDESEPMYFREGKSMIVPYIVVPLADDKESIKIDRIIVGPTPHQELTLKAIQLLMKSQKIECKIEASKTPYRTW